MMLANIAPPTEIAAWLACFAFVVMLVNQGFKAWGNLTGKAHNIAPNRFQVQEVKEGVTRREFNDHVVIDREEHDKLFRKLGGVERGAMERGDARALQINEHIEQVRRDLETKIDQRWNQTALELSEVREQVRSNPAETIALLKQTKGLI